MKLTGREDPAAVRELFDKHAKKTGRKNSKSKKGIAHQQSFKSFRKPKKNLLATNIGQNQKKDLDDVKKKYTTKNHLGVLEEENDNRAQ